MSADAPEPPPPPEIPETPDSSSSPGDDEPGHTTMEDIDDADSPGSGPEGDVANSDASDGPQDLVNGDGDTANPGVGANGSDGPEESGESADSGSPGHDKTRHVAAEDMDALNEADNGVHDGGAGSHPLQSEDPLSAPTDNGAAIGPDPGIPESQGKRSAESNGADEESALTPETAVDEELAVLEKDAEATQHESDGDVTGKSAEGPNGSQGDTEEPTDRPEPTHTSVAGQDADDSGLAEAGEPNDAPDLFEATEPEEPLVAGDPAELAVTDAAAAHSYAGDVPEHRAREEDASDSDDGRDPPEAAAPTEEAQARETLSAVSREVSRKPGDESDGDEATKGEQIEQSPGESSVYGDGHDNATKAAAAPGKDIYRDEQRGAPDEGPDFKEVEFDDRKLTEYALNPEHPVGKHKARVIQSRTGLSQADAPEVKRQIMQQMQGGEAHPGRGDKYGQRWEQDVQLSGPNGDIMIRTAWIVNSENGDTRFVTISFPPEQR